MNQIDDLSQKVEWLPVKCVVCNGYGTTSYGKNICTACKGTGFIKVPTRDDREVPNDQYTR